MGATPKLKGIHRWRCSVPLKAALLGPKGCEKTLATSLSLAEMIGSQRLGFAGLRPYDPTAWGFLPPHDRLGFQVGCLELESSPLVPPACSTRPFTFGCAP